MHGSRSKIHIIYLFSQHCAEGFNFGVKGLIPHLQETCGNYDNLITEKSTHLSIYLAASVLLLSHINANDSNAGWLVLLWIVWMVELRSCMVMRQEMMIQQFYFHWKFNHTAWSKILYIEYWKPQHKIWNLNISTANVCKYNMTRANVLCDCIQDSSWILAERLGLHHLNAGIVRSLCFWLTQQPWYSFTVDTTLHLHREFFYIFVEKGCFIHTANLPPPTHTVSADMHRKMTTRDASVDRNILYLLTSD
jgi:hypothetical protein